MSENITVKKLEAVIDRINSETNNPQTTYTRLPDGKYRTNPGNYHLEQANNRFGLLQVSESGGESTIFSSNTKRELYNLMQAFLVGRLAGYKQGEIETMKSPDEDESGVNEPNFA